jgi:hypothetical protein
LKEELCLSKNKPGHTWATTERMPIAAMKSATFSLEKFITSRRYTKKQEY